MNDELEKTNKLINLAFEHIKPMDYDEVITGLQKENAELRSELNSKDAIINELARGLKSLAQDVNDYVDESEFFAKELIVRKYRKLAEQHLKEDG